MEKLKNKLKELEKDKNSKEDQIMNLVNKKEKEEEIKLLKKDYNFEAEKDKNLMNIIVMAEDESILQPFICKKSDSFLNLKNMLFKRFPEYNKIKTSFFIKDIRIDDSNNLEENNINSGDIIIMNLDL